MNRPFCCFGHASLKSNNEKNFCAGIQGALKHDKIMEPGNHDYVIVEKEAEKVAREASAALKRSRTLCLPATAGVPTWTGQHGATKKYGYFSIIK